jgi:hypothetical protein
MTVKARGLSLNERTLLERVIRSREPSLVPLLDRLGRLSLTEEEREDLRSVLADELCERGLDEEDEPTSYGRALDDVIGKLMFY